MKIAARCRGTVPLVRDASASGALPRFLHTDGRIAGDHIRHDALLALLTLLALFRTH